MPVSSSAANVQGRSVASIGRRLLVILVTATSVFGAAACSDEDQPGCPPTKLELKGSASTSEGPQAVAVGGPLEVRGTGFGTCPGGDVASVEPRQGIRLFVVQGGTRISVAQVNADDSLRFTTTVGVPEGIAPGPAQVRAYPSDKPGAKVLALAALDVATG